MVQNSTLQDVLATTSIIIPRNYDHSGAMIYIVIVLLWYSIGIIMMLGMQMKGSSEIIEESARRRTKLVIRNLRDHTNTKEILEELANKQKRARLWEIYLGTKAHKKDKLNQAETDRIRHIEKQLASITHNRRLANETLPTQNRDAMNFRTRSDSRQVNNELDEDASTLLRRPSSFDQQELERWKTLSDQEKSEEPMQWTQRKNMIRKYFRRNPKRTSPPVDQETRTTDSVNNSLLLFANHINSITRRESNDECDDTSTNDERQNPYLTYFYHPTVRRPSILPTQFFPASSDNSIQ